MDLSFVTLLPGDPAPRFLAATSSVPHFRFDMVAGRYIVLCFFVSGSTPGGGGVTRVGDDCMLMTGAHVGHDARVGSKQIAQGAPLLESQHRSFVHNFVRGLASQMLAKL